MKYSTCIILSIFKTINAMRLTHNTELKENSYVSCPTGYYTNDVTSYSIINCKNCANTTPTHNVAFWTAIVMIFLIIDIVWINLHANRRMSKKSIFYTMVVLSVLSQIAFNIAVCDQPVSMLMIKNYIVLSWIIFISYVTCSVNIMCNRNNNI